MKIKRIILLLFLSVLTVQGIRAQQFALKTNLLYWATTTLNIGGEVSIGDHNSVQVFYGINPWKNSETGRSMRHWVLQPEYRYWFCNAFDGWFIGGHLMGGQFNVGNVNMPLGLLDQLEDNRYEGWFIGGGFTAGYQWVINKHWNFEASLGVGYDYIKYTKFRCGKCGDRLGDGHTNYIGPTKAALSVVYLF